MADALDTAQQMLSNAQQMLDKLDKQPQGKELSVADIQRTKKEKKRLAEKVQYWSDVVTAGQSAMQSSTEQVPEEGATETDENGHPFVVSSDGTTIFGEITEETGLTPAPIKLSEGVVDENGNGYGLLHIEDRHGSQIRNAGFASVEDFVKYVAENYDKDNIKVGKKRVSGVGTFIIQIEDKHSNLLYIELAKDGSYWSVNSGGVFRKGYADKKKNVEQNTELSASPTTTGDTSFVQTDLKEGSKSADTHSDVQLSSTDKDTTSIPENQAEGQEVAENVVVDYNASPESSSKPSMDAEIEQAKQVTNLEPLLYLAQKSLRNMRFRVPRVGAMRRASRYALCISVWGCASVEEGCASVEL